MIGAKINYIDFVPRMFISPILYSVGVMGVGPHSDFLLENIGKGKVSGVWLGSDCAVGVIGKADSELASSSLEVSDGRFGLCHLVRTVAFDTVPAEELAKLDYKNVKIIVSSKWVKLECRGKQHFDYIAGLDSEADPLPFLRELRRGPKIVSKNRAKYLCVEFERKFPDLLQGVDFKVANYIGDFLSCDTFFGDDCAFIIGRDFGAIKERREGLCGIVKMAISELQDLRSSFEEIEGSEKRHKLKTLKHSSLQLVTLSCQNSEYVAKMDSEGDPREFLLVPGTSGTIKVSQTRAKRLCLALERYTYYK